MGATSVFQDLPHTLSSTRTSIKQKRPVWDFVWDFPSKIGESVENQQRSAKREVLLLQQLKQNEEFVKLKGSCFGSSMSGVQIPLPRPLHSFYKQLVTGFYGHLL